MEIKLKKLRLRNFKGLKSFEFSPDGQNCSVFGKNEAGKTTLMDAFIWLLFNKNAEGVSDFNIKTLDVDNQPVHKLDHEVEAVLIIDSMEATLKKTYREKWVKKRGEPEPEFTGHETLYFYNEIPLSEKDYKLKISALCDEAIFKMITNPQAFNALKWTERRAILFNLAGEIDELEIFKKIHTTANHEEIEHLKSMLNNGKTFDEYKKQVAAQKKRMREQLDQIPIRVNELERSRPGLPDVETIKESIWRTNLVIESLDSQIADISKANEAANQKKIERQNQIHVLKTQLLNLENQADIQAKQQVNKLSEEIRGLENEIRSHNNSISNKMGAIVVQENQIILHEKQIANLEDDLKKLTADWHSKNAETLTFDESRFICPACKRTLEPGDIEKKKAELTINFNRDKITILDRITQEGKSKREEQGIRKFAADGCRALIEQYQDEIKTLSDSVTELESKLAELKMQGQQAGPSKEILLASNGDYTTIKSKIQALENQPDETPSTGTQALKDQRNSLQSEITNLTVELKKTDQIDLINQRIDELEGEAKTLGAEIARLEKTEFVIEQFTRAKIDLIEDRINSKFRLARFKMFNVLINGGVEETCETMYQGVPWPDMNGAARVQVGLDIINTLSDHYGVIATIFIDNRESCTEIPEVKAQVINLIVSEKDKILRVKIEKLERATV